MKNIKTLPLFIILFSFLLFVVQEPFFSRSILSKAQKTTTVLAEQQPNQTTQTLENQTNFWNGSASNRLLQRVYQQLATLDGYAFRSTVVQTTHPLPTVANIGLTSKSDSMLIDGSIDRPNDLTLLSLLEQSGSLLDGARQIELKLQKGEVWGRVQERQWEKLDESSKPDPNNSEPAAFLQATHNVQFMGSEERGGKTF